MICADLLLKVQEVSGEMNQQNHLSEKQERFILKMRVRFETVLFTHLKEKVIRALLAVHPYEEVAYDFYSLENKYC